MSTVTQAALDRCSAVRQRCLSHGLILSISENGRHWYFADPSSKHRRAEWWPEKSNLVFDGRYKKAQIAGTADTAWELIATEWGIQCPK